MMKSKLFVIASCCLIFFSCGEKNNSELVVDDEIKGASVEVEPILFEDGESRMEITVREGLGAYFAWDGHDTLGVFPKKGLQVPFPIVKKPVMNASFANFNGGDWGLKMGTSYAAYFPYSRDMYLQENTGVVAVSYLGQKQTANMRLDHLGVYDYLGTEFKEVLPEVKEGSEVVDGGYIHFQMRHLGSILRLELKAPTTAHLKKLTLTSNAQEFGNKVEFNLNSWSKCTSCTNYFHTYGSLDASEEWKHPAATVKEASNKMEVDLSNFPIDANDDLYIYMMMYQTNNRGSQMSYKVETEAGPSWVGTVSTNKEYRPGLIYRLIGTSTTVQP